MSRTCSVCTHPNRDAIETALVSRVPIRDIAASHGLSRSALFRHKTEHVPEVLMLDEAGQEGHISSLLDQLSVLIDRVRKLSDACDEWLQDPEDPGRYDIGPRGSDVTVIHETTGEDGKPRRIKRRLSDLLAQLEEAGYVVDRVEYRHADPRELLVKTADQLRSQLQMLVSVYDRLYNAAEVEAFQQAVLAVLDEVAPEVRERVAQRLRARQPIKGVLRD